MPSPRAGLAERARGSAAWFESTFPGRCLASFVDQQGIDRALVIASQAFTALIPMLILASALAPVGSEDLVADAIVNRFELDGTSADDVELLFAQSGQGSVGVLSVLLLLFSALSLTRRMQRMYLLAWRLEPVQGVGGNMVALLGLSVLLVEITLLSVARTLVRGLPLEGLMSLLLSAAAGVLLWTTVPWLMTNRRLSWRRLLPTGVLTATCVAGYGAASSLYMPRLMTSYSERYGLFGITLALVGWLLAIATLLVTASIVAAEVDRSPGPVAHRLRVRLGLEARHPLPGG